MRPGSMGKPSPGFDVAVIDPEPGGGPGEEGDIAVRVKPERPVGMFKEYWNDPVATGARCARNWYVTGDRATVDEDDTSGGGPTM
ncbi:MAG: AMP-binding protein [Dehalococcoidia bacterium]